MMSKLKSAATGLVSYAKAHPLFFVLFLTVFAVFAAAPFVTLYRKARAAIPGAANVLPAK